MDHERSPEGWIAGPWYFKPEFSFVISKDDWTFGFYWGRDDGCLYFGVPLLVWGVRLRDAKPSHPPCPGEK